MFMGPVLFFVSRRLLEGIIEVLELMVKRHWSMPSVMNFDLLFTCIVSIIYVTI